MNSTKTLILIAFSTSAGCATVTQGKNEALILDSTPQGASVTTSNGHTCDSTPCAIQMPRRSEFEVTFELAGCEPKTVNVTHQTSKRGGTAVAGNILAGGLIGLSVDAATGASQELVPNPVLANLDC